MRIREHGLDGVWIDEDLILVILPVSKAHGNDDFRLFGKHVIVPE